MTPLLVRVAVLTFRRPDDLRAIVPLLLAQVAQVNAAGRYRADLLVVDNDPSANARPVLHGSAHAEVRYALEPRAGIAAARNRALAESSDADLLAFIDDDERPRAEWLCRLLEAHRAGEPAGVAGPVVSRFDGPLDPWIDAGRFFARDHRADLPTGAAIRAAATNNLLLDLRQVRRLDLRFAEDLGYCAGEDNLFTRTLVRRGGRLIWCAEAVVDEPVPVARVTRRWVLQRSFSAGNAAARVDARMAGIPLRRIVVRWRAGGSGLARLFGGALRWVRGRLTGSLVDRARGAHGRAWRRDAARAGGYGYPAYRPSATAARPSHERTAR